MRVLGRLAGVALAVAILVLAPARPAWAHAELASSDPADGSVVETGPAQVTLQFTEAVSVQSDGVRILDGDGARVDAGTATATDATVTVTVDGALLQGGYVVAWRAVSADGHAVRGAFSFSVGERTALRAGLGDDAFSASADTRDDLIGAVLRGLGYLGVLGATGAVLVGAALRRDGEPSPVGRVVAGLGGVGLAGMLLQVPLQASLATGRGWGSIADEGVLGLALGDGVGWSIALTGAGLAGLLVTAGLPFSGTARALALAGAALAPIGLVVAGHTRTMSPAAVGYAADTVHVLAAAVWFGGLGALLAAVRRRRRAGDSVGAAEAVARFSGWAAAVAAGVVVAGTILGWIEVGGLDPLTGTAYGRLLMVKVGLVAVVIGGAAWNRFRLVPSLYTAPEGGRSGGGVGDADHFGLGDGDVGGRTVEPGASTVLRPAGRRGSVATRSREVRVPDIDTPVRSGAIAEGPEGPGGAGPGDAEQARIWTRLVGVARFEVAAMVVVLAVTAVLSNVTPAETAADGDAQSASAPLGTGSVEVLVDPSRPGRNDIHVYLLDAEDRPDDRFDDATFRLALPAKDLGPLDRKPVPAAPGHFQLLGTNLDLAGEWTLTITVKPDRFTEQTATVTFQVR